jgi:uncharacterized SAM-binding protein YcdF (DUF218 family)
MFLDFAKEFLVPGSFWFLTLAATFCTIALFGPPAWRSRGRAILAIVLAWYWVTSLPITADILRALSLSRVDHLRDASMTRSADVIVVLGNGTLAYHTSVGGIVVPLPQTASNILEGVEQHRQHPTIPIIASGGGASSGFPARAGPGWSGAGDVHSDSEASAIKEALTANGVPSDLISLEDQSTNTREQAADVSRLMKAKGMSVCWLVTAATHMPRAMTAFRAQGIQTIPEPAGPPTSGPLQPQGWLRYLPSSDARSDSRDAIYEVAASIYYWMGGR